MSKPFLRILFLLATFALLDDAPALADTSQPIRLTVDATQAPQKIIRVRMVIPAAPGPLTLYYPKWIKAFTHRSGRSPT